MIARLRVVLRRSLPLALASLTVGFAACGSDEGSSSGNDGAGGPAADGRELAEDQGCQSCHREGGGGIGPDFEGLAGSTVTLDDGATVVGAAVVGAGAAVVGAAAVTVGLATGVTVLPWLLW